MSWIKMRVDLRNHPKVVRMASALKADRLRIIGGLWAVWGTFDAHSVDGRLDGYTLSAIDEDLAWKGFGAAMQSVQWLHEDDDGLTMPEFNEHNGASAKRRATDARRKASGREEDKEYGGSWTDGGQESESEQQEGGQMSASDADKKQTRVREEKEKKNSSSSSARASRLPPDWEPGEEGWKFAASKGLANGSSQAEFEQFRDHWAAKSGVDATKLDWQATWRTWVRNAIKFQGNRKPAEGDLGAMFRRGEA